MKPYKVIFPNLDIGDYVYHTVQRLATFIFGGVAVYGYTIDALTLTGWCITAAGVFMLMDMRNLEDTLSLANLRGKVDGVEEMGDIFYNREIQDNYAESGDTK